MKFEFPDTGEGVTEGKFLDWKISEGDAVEEDQVVGEAETDKAVVEIPAPSDGTVKELMAEPGDQVEVGEVIMELETGKEDTEEVQDKSKEEEPTNEETKEVEQVEHSSEDVLALPKVRRIAKEKRIDLESLNVEGRIREEDLEGVEKTGTKDSTEENVKSDETEEVDESVSTPEDVKATPSVRKLAREKGIDISKVEGSGRGGKATREDVKTFNEDTVSDSETEESREVVNNSSVSGENLSGLEKNIARKMTESRFSAPHVTHVEKIDMTSLADLREKANSDIEAHLTYMPFIMKASMLAIKNYPRMNAHFNGEKMEIDTKEEYNFNIAIDTEKGLLVPRIDEIGEKNLLEIAQDLADTVQKAQNSKLNREDMNPGSFSITNLGVIGGEEFTPIINPPQTCILGIGKISETAEVVEGEVVPRMTMKLSFSYDHRVIDGAKAARFVNEIKENLENPEEMMVSL